jgi:hypothetical protein
MPKSKRKDIWVVESRVCDWDGYEPTYVVDIVQSRNAAKRRLAAWARAVNADSGGYHVCELRDGKAGTRNSDVVEGYGHVGNRRAWRATRGAYDGCSIRPDGRVRYPWE